MSQLRHCKCSSSALRSSLSLFYLIVPLFMEMLVLSVHCDIFSCLYMQIKLQDFYLTDGVSGFYSLLTGLLPPSANVMTKHFVLFFLKCTFNGFFGPCSTRSSYFLSHFAVVSSGFIPFHPLLSQTPHKQGKKKKNGGGDVGAPSPAFSHRPPSVLAATSKRLSQLTIPRNISPRPPDPCAH